MSVTLATVSSVATSVLVAFYNDRAENPVKKFATRAIAEARVTAILEAEAAARAAKPAGRTLAQAITESWKNPETAAKRATRHGVIANGQEYRSVREAFTALRLPIAKHIPFRMALKAAGEAVFEAGKKRVEFVLLASE